VCGICVRTARTGPANAVGKGGRSCTACRGGLSIVLQGILRFKSRSQYRAWLFSCPGTAIAVARSSSEDETNQYVRI
jgi:hypothetical protein